MKFWQNFPILSTSQQPDVIFFFCPLHDNNNEEGKLLKWCLDSFSETTELRFGVSGCIVCARSSFGLDDRSVGLKLKGKVLNACFGLSWCGRWLLLWFLLTLCLNQFCNEDPAVYLQLPFNFTIFIMSALVVWKVSVETQPAFWRVSKGRPSFSVSAGWVRFGFEEQNQLSLVSEC